MAEPIQKQLGDLKPGEWFDRQGNLHKWVVTDQEGSDGVTLCVRPSTGQAEYLDNSEKVYPIQRPY
jgi:hypothetical protein